MEISQNGVNKIKDVEDFNKAGLLSKKGVPAHVRFPGVGDRSTKVHGPGPVGVYRPFIDGMSSTGTFWRQYNRLHLFTGIRA